MKVKSVGLCEGLHISGEVKKVQIELLVLSDLLRQGKQKQNHILGEKSIPWFLYMLNLNGPNLEMLSFRLPNEYLGWEVDNKDLKLREQTWTRDINMESNHSVYSD